MNIEQLNATAGGLIDLIVRASWQGGVAAAAVWVVCQCFPRLPASACSWLWRLVLLKVLLALLWMRPLEVEVFPTGQPVAVASEAAHDLAGNEGRVSASGFASDLPLNVAPIPQPAVPSPELHWQFYVAAAWVGGLLCGLTSLAVQYVRARRLRAASSPCDDDRLLTLLIPLVREFKLPGVPRVRVAPGATRPMLVGLGRPTLIFPENLIATDSSESLRMMLAHELAHIRRFDLGWSVFTAFVQAVFFFHPLVWLARRESILAQEMACDELAVRATASPAARYAEMLVEVVSIPAVNPVKLISLGIADHCKTLERRIRSMKFIGRDTNFVTKLMAHLAVLVLFLALIPVRLVEAKPDRHNDWPEPERNWPAEKLDPTQLLLQLRDKPRADLRKIIPSLVPDRNLNRYLEDLAKAEQEWASLGADRSEDHPEMKRLAQVMAAIDRQIESRIDGILGGLEVKVAQNRESSAAEPLAEAPIQADKSEVSVRLVEKLRSIPRSELRNIITTVVLDRNLERLLDDLAKAEQQRAALSSDFSEEHPELQRVNQVIALINRQIEVRIDGILAGLELQKGQNKWAAKEKPDSDAGIQPDLLSSEPSAPIAVYARAAGMVEIAHVTIGASVKVGQLLIKMDSFAARSRLASAEARGQMAGAEVQVAQADLRETERDYKEKQKMIEQGAAPASSLPNLEKAMAHVRKAEALLQIAQIETEQAKNELGHCELRAPVDGVILSIVPNGFFVSEGGKVLAEIANPTQERAAQRRKIKFLEATLQHFKERQAELLQSHTATHPEVVRSRQGIMELTNRLKRYEELQQTGASATLKR